ncbi:MAG: mercury resistance system periplasmic binding protein MerP [Thiohalomonadales bacterium]
MFHRKLFSSTFTIIILFLSLSYNANAIETKTVTLDIPGMTCKFCPITIRKALEKVPGVINAKAEYETKTATVTYDPQKTTVEKLTNATKNAGYPATLKQN